MNKFLGFIMAFVILLLAIVPQGAFAAVAPTITFAAEKLVKYTNVGDVVTIPVRVSASNQCIPAGGLLSAEATVKYDSSVLQYVSSEAGPIVKNACTNFSALGNDNCVKLTFMDEDKGPNMITSAGVFANIKLKVIKGIEKESVISIEDALCAAKGYTIGTKVINGSVISEAAIANSITPRKVEFDIINPANIAVKIADWDTLSDIKAGGTSLAKGTDYTVSGNTVIINKNYYQYIFSKWPTYSNVLTFFMSSGNTTTLTTTPKAVNSLIAPAKTVFDISNPGDVIVTIASGETLSDIKAGSASLIKGIDYTVSDNMVTINKSYYKYIFDKWPTYTNILTFVMLSGKSSILTTTAKAGNSLIIPAKTVFDINNPDDVIVTISSDETLSDIKSNSSSLVNGVDYTVSGNTVKVHKSYYQYIFSKWPQCTNTLTFIMKSGKTAILNTSSGTQLIAPSKAGFYMGCKNSVTVRIAEGETLSDIKAGSTSLVKGTDYVTVGNIVTISKYFEYIFTKWPNTVCNLTFVMKSGNAATLSTTRRVPDPSVAPSNIRIISGKSEDRYVTLTLNGDTLSSVANGTYTLKPGIDYSLTGNVVILKSEYLNSLTKNVQLVFNYGSGKSSTLYVMPGVSSITVTLGSTVAESGSVVTIPVTLKNIPEGGLAGVDFIAMIDPAYIESASIEAGPICTNPSRDLYLGREDSSIHIEFQNGWGIENEGVLLYLKLKLKPEIKGTTSIRVLNGVSSLPNGAIGSYRFSFNNTFVDSTIIIN